MKMIIACESNRTEMLVANGLADGHLVFVEKDDGAVLRRLDEECRAYDPVENGGVRMECWLVVEDAETLWMLQTVGVPEHVREKADVVAFTMDDLLAKMVLVRMPDARNVFPPLDRKPVRLADDSTVHFVIAGYSPLAEAFALNAALVAHYPNYCRDTSLRTRITLIGDGVLEKSRTFIQRYSNLFENSYYRTLNLKDADPVCVLHRPVYEGVRKDFVDVEWEFVDGDIRDDAVRQKLKEWSVSQRQQLTVALCDDDQGVNVSASLSLPDEIYRHCIPVLCHTDDTSLLEFARMDKRYAEVLPFGRSMCRLDSMRMLKKLAKRVNYAYNHAFSLKPDDVVSAPAMIDGDEADKQWNSVVSLPKIYSNLFNAMTLGTKMHSMGHASDDWENYYALSKEEIGVLMEVEHNRWNVEELILGYRPVTDDEQKLVEKDKSLKRKFRNDKIHYDLRSFDDLREDSTGKNVNVYDYVLTQSIPLIIKSCIAE